jgi:hypothetical protein
MVRSVGVVAAVLGVLAACSSEASGQEKFVDDFCGIVAPCCVKLGKSGDTGSCKSLLGFGAGFDQAKGDACIADLRSRQSDPSFCDTGFLGTAACKDVFKSSSSGGPSGSAKVGEACQFESDCAKDPRGDVSCTFGKICQVRLVGKEGDPCNGTSYSLKGGTATSFNGSGTDALAQITVCDSDKSNIYCDDAARTCKAIGGAGSSCTGDVACPKTAYCKSGQCVDRVPVGGTCTFSDCVAEARCDSATKTCVALLADGAACQTGSDCASSECDKGKCVAFGTGIGSAFALGLLCGN